MNKYDTNIMGALRQNLGLKADDVSKDQLINTMSKDEVLDRVATWNGLLGYGYTIKSWVERIYGIMLLDDDE